MCENHLDRAWDGARACGCGCAGVPCTPPATYPTKTARRGFRPGFQRGESLDPRLNASARRAWENAPSPALTSRTPVPGGDRDAWRGSIPWLARHRAVRARQARRHEVDQGVRLSRRTRHGDAGMDTREKLPALALGMRLRCPMCGSRRAVDLHRAARSADGARRKIGAEVKSVTPWVTAARRTH